MGKRGAGWVVGQFVLAAAILLAPRGGLERLPRWTRGVGIAGIALGSVVAAVAAGNLGRNLTPFPQPREGGDLVRVGLYGVVRHPIYMGLGLTALGWGLWQRSVAALGLAGLLCAFFDAKARHEERWLRTCFPEYATYQRAVRRLIPWLY